MSKSGSGLLGTREISEICGCSAVTVCHWIDRGELVGFRMPGAKGRLQQRRVHRDDLIVFLERINHPAAAVVRGPQTILACGLALDAPPGWLVTLAACPAAVGAVYQRQRPVACVVSVGAWGVPVALDVARWLLAHERPPRVLLVAPEDVVPEDLQARCVGASAVAGPLSGFDLGVWLVGGQAS